MSGHTYRFGEDSEPKKTEEEQDKHYIYYSSERESKPFISETYVLQDTCTSPPLELNLVETLGYDSYRRNNLHKIDTDNLLFIAGNYIVVHKLSTGKNTYIHSTGGVGVKCLAVNIINERCFASGECGKSPVINIYGYPACRLRKVLRQGTQREYTCMQFDPYTGELLASHGGGPDYSLTIWKWVKEVPLLRCKSVPRDVLHVSWNQDLFGFLVTSGVGHIHFWSLAATFTGLKLKGQTGRFGTRDQADIEASILFPDGKVLTGSDAGAILLWEEALLKAEFRRRTLPNCHKDRLDITSIMTPEKEGQIHQMLLQEGEVITLGEDGYIRMWPVDTMLWVDPTDSGEVFLVNPLHEIHVAQCSGLKHMVPTDTTNSEDRRWLVQDAGGTVWNVDLDIGVSHKTVAVFSKHGGPVLACAVSPITHLAATVGEDFTLRIFDCIQCAEVLCMRFTSMATCLVWVPLSVDPHAASIIVGFGSGIIRKIAFSERSSFGPAEDQSASLAGKLSEVFKPHKRRVTSISIFETDSNYFVSGSSDGSLFLFHVTKAGKFDPVGWAILPVGIRQLTWTPTSFSYVAVLAACEDGIVVEVLLENFSELTVAINYRFIELTLNMFKFQSVKSDFEHDIFMFNTRREAAFDKKAQEESDDNKVKDEEEEEEEEEWAKDEDWRPYMPEEASPILQAVYSTQNHKFWLSLGNYDAEYLYLCNFTHPPVKASDIRADLSSYLTKPLKLIAVPNTNSSAVTVLIVYREQALLGFSNGHVRLVQIESELGLEDLGAYCDLAVHDNSVGSVTGLQFAFDKTFVLTTGMDGNVMLFDYRGRLARLDKKKATLPFTCLHHDTCNEDMNPDAYWFPDAVDKSRHDKKVNAAEKSKKQKRTLLKQLQQNLRAVLWQNDQIPRPHRLSPLDLLINLQLKEEYEEKHKKVLVDLRERYTWQREKSRLLLSKIQEGFYLHEDMPHQFSVTAFSNPNLAVKSYRMPKPLAKIGGAVASVISLASILATPRNIAEDDEPENTWADDEEVWKKAYELTRRRSRGLTGSAFRSLKMFLDKALKCRQRRNARKKEWDLLYEQKSDPERLSNPRDMAEIEMAKQTIGDLKLKTDLARRAMEMVENSIQDDYRANFVNLDHEIYNKITAFNDKVRRLRQSKLAILHVYDHLNQRILKVSHGTRKLPRPRILSREEAPEADLAFDETFLLTFWKDNKDSLNDGDFSKLAKDNAARFHHQYYKGKPQDYPDIVKLTKRHTAESYVETEDYVDMDPILLGLADQSEMTSDLRQYINTFVKLQIDFEEALVNSLFQNIVDEFDDRLAELRKEKFKLDMNLTNAELDYCLKMTEDLMDQENIKLENELKTQLISRQQELLKIQDTIARLKIRIADTTTESENVTKKSNELWNNFEALVVDMEGKRMMTYLTLLFKRRLKKKRERPEDEEYDSESESSSDMSEMMSEAGSDVSSISLDLDYCPDILSQELYDSVLFLQADRQALDDSQIELKKNIVNLSKELELKKKEADVTGKAAEKVQARTVLYYENKIRLHNELEVVVVLPQFGIHSSISECIVIEKQTIRRLLNRIVSLKAEQHKQKLIMKSDRKRHVSLRNTVASLENKVAQKSAQCEDAIVKKFGKPVSLQKLELVSIDPKLEILRCRLLAERSEHLEELQKFNTEINDTKSELMRKTRVNSAKTRAKATLEWEKLQRERSLNHATMAIPDISDIIPCEFDCLGDRKMMLTRIIQEQAAVIHECWGTISSMSWMRKRSQHISQGHSVSRARSIPPMVPRQRRTKYLAPL